MSDRRNATYEDLLALPEHVTGQILFGVLHAFPRPAPKHARASSVLGADLGGPFDRGRGGPGGWLILDGPELHLGPHVVVPDLAGWRRERMPEMPVDRAYFVLAPDWACEVLSPRTAGPDRGDKRAVYAAERVQHLWVRRSGGVHARDPRPRRRELSRRRRVLRRGTRPRRAVRCDRAGARRPLGALTPVEVSRGASPRTKVCSRFLRPETSRVTPLAHRHV